MFIRNKGYFISTETHISFKGFHLAKEEEAFNKAATNCLVVGKYEFMKITEQFGFLSHKQHQKLYWQQDAKAYLAHGAWECYQ